MKEQTKICIVGLGGLGIPALIRLLNQPTSLAFTIFEDDDVELSNLPRQVLFQKEDLTKPKLDALALALKRETELFSNQSHQVIYRKYKLTQDNLAELDPFDAILDCTDDPILKYAISDYCKIKQKYLVHAGAQGQSGFTMLVSPDGPCLRCVFGEPDTHQLAEYCNSCRVSGILGAYSGLTGAYQAELALQVIDGVTSPSAFRINTSGTKSLCFEIDEDCILCAKHKELDLRTINCPETFVYTKLALLKRSNSTEKLLVNFKQEEDLLSVKQSILEEGFTVLSTVSCDASGTYKLLVQ